MELLSKLPVKKPFSSVWALSTAQADRAKSKDSTRFFISKKNVKLLVFQFNRRPPSGKQSTQWVAGSIQKQQSPPVSIQGGDQAVCCVSI